MFLDTWKREIWSRWILIREPFWNVPVLKPNACNQELFLVVKSRGKMMHVMGAIPGTIYLRTEEKIDAVSHGQKTYLVSML
jgi:hypothetical protein